MIHLVRFVVSSKSFPDVVPDPNNENKDVFPENENQNQL